jgi:hypothetical protein
MDGRPIKAWSASGHDGINTAVWNLSPEEQSVSKGVYAPAFKLVDPGVYRVELQAGADTVSGELDVRAPDQAKVGSSPSAFPRDR